MRRAAILETYGEPLKLNEVDAVSPSQDGIVVETEACGICRSDWHAWKGHWPSTPEGHILGHEPAGTVTAVGDEVEQFAVGDQVGVPFNIACGRCDACWDGQSHLCDDGYSLGFSPKLPGAFTSEFAVPNADFNVVHLPDGLDPIDMAALGCRFATAFHGLAHKADINAGDWLAIHGCGGLGLSAVAIANALGANVIAVDLDEEALQLAGQMGADAKVNADDTESVPEAVQDVTDGGAAISVDALGIAETCRNSVLSLGRQGQHLQIGMTTDEEAGEVALPVDRMISGELETIGVKGMPPHRYQELLRMISSGKVDPSQLVTKEVGLEEVSDRLASMDDYGTLGVEVVTEF